MERCEVCGGEIRVNIFKGTKVDCEICRKLRQRLYDYKTAIREVSNNFPMDRQAKAFQYIKRHFVPQED